VTPDSSLLLRWIDLILVVAFAPFAVLAGLPLLGYGVGAVAWIASRVAGNAIERKAKTMGSVNKTVGIALFSSLGRAWAVGLSILAVGLAGEREDGATAAILVLVAFTVYLVATLMLRSSERTPSR
jgi:hypothetical protein